MAVWFSKKSNSIRVIAAAVMIVAAMAAWQYYQWLRFLSTPLVESKPYVFIFKPGQTVINLAWDLHRAGHLPKPKKLITLARRKKLTTKLQAGEYQFNPGTTPLALLEKMARGQVMNHTITFIEGQTFKQMMLAIKKDVSIEHTLKGMSNKQIMKRLGHPGQHPEGLFYPDTYRFRYGMTDQQILKRSYNAMQKKLLFAWQHRGPDLPYPTPYQALIVASLLEKEAGLAKERPIIADVILKRIKKKMRLQIDPTVIYALGDKYDGSLSRSDLRVRSPYNTYMNRGLPPTPIANPSETSIWAAMHPERNEYLYFVAKGDGSHQFSKTLVEQIRAINRYIRKKTSLKTSVIPKQTVAKQTHGKRNDKAS